MRAGGSSRRPQAERAVHVYPGVGRLGARDDLRGGVKRAGVDVAGLKAHDRVVVEPRHPVDAHSASTIDRNADHALAPQAEQRQRLEDAHVDRFADEHRDRRRSKQALGLDIPRLPGEERVSGRRQAGEIRLRRAGDEPRAAFRRQPQEAEHPAHGDLFELGGNR